MNYQKLIVVQQVTNIFQKYFGHKNKLIVLVGRWKN